MENIDPQSSYENEYYTWAMKAVWAENHSNYEDAAELWRKAAATAKHTKNQHWSQSRCDLCKKLLMA